MNCRAVILSITVFLASCGKKELPPAKQRQALPENFEQNARTTVYPGAEWDEIAPEKAGINREKLKVLEQYLFPEKLDEVGRTGIRTDAFLLVRGGKIVFERYARQFHRNRRHLVWSVTKSFVNTFIGMAVLDGRLKIEDSVSKYYPALSGGGKEAITIDHMLRQSSGLFWSEGYESSPLKSSVVAMLYTRGRNNMGAFAAAEDLIYPPGTHWYYSSGNSNLLMAMLRNVYPIKDGKDELEDLMFNRLFKAIGMRYVTFERDGAGIPVGSSYLYMTARDLARFGYLYLHDGVWQGKRLLPEKWVRYTTTMAPAYYTTELHPEDKKDNPGAHWYVNLGIPERNQEPPWPDAPSDTFAALGHWGQSLFVIPSLDIVAVRFGDDRDGSFNKNRYLGLIKNSLEKAP
ncbi:MAG: beta-lactamase family protein [Leptospiraceae bacterium]|nr:beta-lactamase family protein [Leptospiraceae bacterium]